MGRGTTAWAEASDPGVLRTKRRQRQPKDTFDERDLLSGAIDCDDASSWMSSGASYGQIPLENEFPAGKATVAGTLFRIKGHPKLAATVASSAPFAFERRKTRIDWRRLHGVDVDRVVRTADIDTLETVLDTIAFGDLEAEDTRNFTEANFVKIFRLSQLMVEYLLHVQETLAGHKAQLVVAGAAVQRKNEKMHSQLLQHRDALTMARKELKQAKKTLSTYEILLRLHGAGQGSLASGQQVHKCAVCDKLFESSYYLDVHTARRHPKAPEEDPKAVLAAAVSKAEEATAARVRAETTQALQVEFDLLLARTKADFEKAEQAANSRVAQVQAVLTAREVELAGLRERLEDLQRQLARHSGAGNRIEDDDAEKAHQAVLRSRELEGKVAALEERHKQLAQERDQLAIQLLSAQREVAGLQAERQRLTDQLTDRQGQVDILQKQKKAMAQELEEAREAEAEATAKLRKERGRVKAVAADLEAKHEEEAHALRVEAEQKAKAAAAAEERRRRAEKEKQRLEEEEQARREEESRKAEAERARRRSAEEKARKVEEKEAQTEEEESADEKTKEEPAPRAAPVRLSLGDASEEVPWLSVADKERWLAEHPYAPLANNPNALAKFPHDPALFPPTRKDITKHFEEALAEELRTFGISPSAKGLTDRDYVAAANALEQRRAARLASANAPDRKQMEYERGTILWHVERAATVRDEEQIEARLRGVSFDEPSPKQYLSDGPAPSVATDMQSLQSPDSQTSVKRTSVASPPPAKLSSQPRGVPAPPSANGNPSRGGLARLVNESSWDDPETEEEEQEEEKKAMNSHNGHREQPRAVRQEQKREEDTVSEGNASVEVYENHGSTDSETESEASRTAQRVPQPLQRAVSQRTTRRASWDQAEDNSPPRNGPVAADVASLRTSEVGSMESLTTLSTSDDEEHSPPPRGGSSLPWGAKPSVASPLGREPSAQGAFSPSSVGTKGEDVVEDFEVDDIEEINL